MTNHYMAQIDGVTVTRSTAGRAYTHVVVGYVDVAQARVKCEGEARKSYASHIRTNTKYAAGQTHYLDWSTDVKMLTMFTSDLSAEARAAKIAERKAEYLGQHEAAVAASQAVLAADKGEEVWVAKALAEFDTRRANATNNSTDGRYFICDLGWASRLDLAEKNAATHAKHAGYGYAKVAVLEAVQVTKAAKPSKSKATR